MTIYPDGPSEEDDWVGFISMMALLHPNGRAVAHLAYKEGLKLGDIFAIMLLTNADGSIREDMPQLLFQGPRPVNVTPEGVF